MRFATRYKAGMPAQDGRNDTLLDQACHVLGLVDGCLLQASSAPTNKNVTHWTDKGDWLALASEVGAQNVFFVDNEPVLVLAELPEGSDERSFFNRIWSMARPQLLFLLRAGQLAVYKLGGPPVRAGEQLDSPERLFDLAKSAQEILSKLSTLQRESIETGQVYGDERFGSTSCRADRALVRDLKAVRKRLTEGPNKLDPSIAHALIGRALFVRYLEDRGVLVPDYFAAVARKRPEWTQLLSSQTSEVFAEARFADVQFFRVLQDRDFTYEFFRQIAHDFNGDTFAITTEEESDVKSVHLDQLRGLLMGDDGSAQGHLFLFAYRFEIIPIELISSIYEDFYSAQRGKNNTQSSYYTRPALVDFLLSRVLTKEVLDSRPRAIDPACGSGIFLVESFRRMVRHRVAERRHQLSQEDLRAILRDQIRGVDLNPEAVPVAAFSLYLAYLHYQKPCEINEHQKLPNLRFVPARDSRDPEQHLDILFTGNAFDAIECPDPVARERFGPGSADVVVGNPPWGKVKKDDRLGREAFATIARWCAQQPERVIGDKEVSQAFVHLTLELLANGGRAALLLSSGVLFKQHDNSRSFRKSWLRRCRLVHVVNFAHVRRLYFSDPSEERRVLKGKKKAAVREKDGAAPFISAIFEKAPAVPGHRFCYWSARRVAEVEKTRAIVISQGDMHRLTQDDCLRYESNWKIYWWGGVRDEGLVRQIERFPRLGDLPDEMEGVEVRPGRGFLEGNKRYEADWLTKYKALSANDFRRYGKLPQLHKVPDWVERRGAEDVYHGHRLLLNRGVGADGIVARLETTNFCFSHSIEGFQLLGLEPWQEQVLLGIFWSSLAKYYLWLTAGSWGTWHDEIYLETASRVPIAFPRKSALRGRILKAVNDLRGTDLLPGDPGLRLLEDALDDAVFDLYELNAGDRDLVRDMCSIGIDFLYNHSASKAVATADLPKLRHGLACDLPKKQSQGLAGYLQVFLRQWNADLAPGGELAWEVVPGPGTLPVMAVLFSVTEPGRRAAPANADGRMSDWAALLTRIARDSLVPAEVGRTLYTDTFVRAVSDKDIVIIKRNETRFWSRSAALGDADATVAQAMNLAERKA